MPSINDPASAAQAAADAIRTLSHVTVRLSPAGYQNPSDVYDVMVQITRLARLLPEALRQAEEWLGREADAGRIFDDRNGAVAKIDPMQTVEHVAMEMTAARVHLTRWADATRLATEHLSHLGRTLPPVRVWPVLAVHPSSGLKQRYDITAEDLGRAHHEARVQMAEEIGVPIMEINTETVIQ